VTGAARRQQAWRYQPFPALLTAACTCRRLHETWFVSATHDTLSSTGSPTPCPRRLRRRGGHRGGSGVTITTVHSSGGEVHNPTM
jgi:hypothetical protein